MIFQLEADRISLQNQNADHMSDLASLKKELLQAEQTRMDIESAKVALLEKAKFLDIEKDKVSRLKLMLIIA